MKVIEVEQPKKEIPIKKKDIKIILIKVGIC